MARLPVFLGVFLAVTLFQITQGYKPCIVPTKADTDEAWFIATAANTWHLVEHSDCDNCEKQEAWGWLRAAGRTIPKRMCWMFHVTTRFGPYVLPFNCKYHDIAKEECELDFSTSDIKDKLRWGGQFIFTKTDNKTFVAGTTCIFGKENFWWLIVSDPKNVRPGLVEEVRADMVKLGFQAGNIAKEGTSQLFLRKLSAHPEFC